MKRSLATVLVFSVVLGGCAQLVKKNYGASKGCTVKYTKELFMTDKNRKKAMEVANDYCAPQRAILLSEEEKHELTGDSHTETTHKGKHSYSDTHETKQSTVYLNFRCGGGGKRVARN
jgi:hypothetical protein